MENNWKENMHRVILEASLVGLKISNRRLVNSVLQIYSYFRNLGLAPGNFKERELFQELNPLHYTIISDAGQLFIKVLEEDKNVT